MKKQELINELLIMIRDGEIIVWDVFTRTLKSVVSLSENGNSLQFNVEVWDDEDAV